MDVESISISAGIRQISQRVEVVFSGHTGDDTFRVEVVADIEADMGESMDSLSRKISATIVTLLSQPGASRTT